MISKRLLTSVAIALGAIGLSACGSQESGPQATTVNLSQSAQYVRRPPATTEPAAPVEEVSATIEGAQTYVIQKGDYFSKIADQFGVTVSQIVEYNGFGSSQYLLLPGNEIKIPPGAKNPAAAPAPAADPAQDAAASDSATAADTSEGCEYTIKAGDWPNKVAKKFDVTLEQLQTVNSSGVMNSFLPGAVLKIPPGGSC